MITLAATLVIVAVVAAIVIGVGRAIAHALRDAGRTIDIIIEEEVTKRPGSDDQFTRWPSVRT